MKIIIYFLILLSFSCNQDEKTTELSSTSTVADVAPTIPAPENNFNKPSKEIPSLSNFERGVKINCQDNECSKYKKQILDITNNLNYHINALVELVKKGPSPVLFKKFKFPFEVDYRKLKWCEIENKKEVCRIKNTILRAETYTEMNNRKGSILLFVKDWDKAKFGTNKHIKTGTSFINLGDTYMLRPVVFCRIALGKPYCELLIKNILAISDV